MGDLTGRGFGLVIAYLLPGFVLLLGVAELSPEVGAWLRTSADSNSPTVGSFLYVLLSSLTAGMTVGAFRWAIIDSIHHATGLTRPIFQMANLYDRLPAFELLVEHHYRYYEFFANTFLAAFASYGCWRVAASVGDPQPSDAGFVALQVIFFAASRNTLRTYYRRVGQLLGTVEGEPSHDERIRPSRAGPNGNEPAGEGPEAAEPGTEPAGREGEGNPS